MPAVVEASAVGTFRHVTVSVVTTRPTEFVDLTAVLSTVIVSFGVREGVLMVQTRHTTTGLMINEHEPLLLADLEAMFERIAPASAAYAHDDFALRTVNLTPGERRNGHAHCRAALLRSSESVAIVDGALALGRWQRVFLVEFDGPQRREVCVTVAGKLSRSAYGV